MVGGGTGNTAIAAASTVGGGEDNEASGNHATVSGGWNNTASGSASFIGGGVSNEATNDYDTIAGGWDNAASGSYSAIGGGASNQASGPFATIPGGNINTAAGVASFAAGTHAQANNLGCFVWGDASTTNSVSCSTNNRTIFRSSGGYYIYTNPALSSGVYLSAGGNSWVSVSDAARKANFRPVDTHALLDNLAAVPITTWNYLSQDASIRHIGPMAQDFNSLLPDLGGEGYEYINTLDADGVALAAIQGLYEVVQEKDAQIDALEARIDALEAGGVAAASSWAASSLLSPATLFSAPACLLAGAALLRSRKQVRPS